jgi:hypothetical protein
MNVSELSAISTKTWLRAAMALYSSPMLRGEESRRSLAAFIALDVARDSPFCVSVRAAFPSSRTR